MMRTTSVAALWVMLVGCVWVSAATASPVVPGYEQLKASGKSDAVMRGELLLGELNCLMCHDADAGVKARINTKGAPNLSDVGARLTPQYLRKYLVDVHGTKPGTTMPDIFHASEGRAKEGAADFLLHFLVAQGGPIRLDQSSGAESIANQGKKLFHEVGCVACHAPEGGKDTKVPSVPLTGLATKTTVDALAKFLMDPAKIRAGGRMPSLRLTRGEANAIAVYLLRDQLNNPQNEKAKPASQPGIAYAYYESKMGSGTPAWDKLKPKATGVAPTFTIKPKGLKRRNDNFAFRFTGTLHIDKPGKYTFYTTSDDGSELFINTTKVVNNGGVHGMQEKKGSIELDAGAHAIAVTMWEVGGGEGLNVHWQGPGIKKKQPIPPGVLTAEGGMPMLPLESEPGFAVEGRKAEMGARMFTMLKCIKCHSDGMPAGAAPPFARRRAIPSFEQLNVNNPEGCLGNNIRKAVPNYKLTAEQKSDILAALAARNTLSQPRNPADDALYHVAAFNCLACHQRDGVGGPGDVREKYFETNVKIDLGDEGRIPPTLTGVGSKLKTEALTAIMFEAKLHVRPYMATRMPTFHKPASIGVAKALVAADRKPDDLKSPPFTEQSVHAGRRLVGVSPIPAKSGLGCINCHNMAGRKSIGIPGIDLATVHARLTPGWFKRWLAQPQVVKPGTRMPGFWAPGAKLFPDVMGGDPEKQHEAIWNYLSLGETMPLPAGFSAMANKNEIVPVDTPVMYRTFMQDTSPRAIVIGYPEKVNAAFDGNLVRMAKVWKGRFWDPSNTWTGRSGGFGKPLGTDVRDLPTGPALAFLDSGADPWPNPDIKKARDVGGDFRGYRLDKNRRPVFRYVLNGVSIEEAMIPQLQQGGVTFLRRFKIDAPNNPEGLYLLAGEGKKIQKNGDAYVVDDGQMTLKVRADDAPTIRESEGRQQLVIPVSKKQTTIEVEIQW